MSEGLTTITLIDNSDIAGLTIQTVVFSHVCVRLTRPSNWSVSFLYYIWSRTATHGYIALLAE